MSFGKFRYIIYRIYLIMIKLDSRQKYEKIRKFLGELKIKKNIEPFLELEDIQKFGIYDFGSINKNSPTFSKIQKNLKESKYDELNQFLADLKQIFISVSDYAFIDDPLQQICDDFKQEIDKFGQNFIEEFKVMYQQKIVKPVSKPPPAIVPIQPAKAKEIKQAKQTAMMVQEVVFRQRSSNLSEKLEMIFHLRANENNQSYLRSIGIHYRMGVQMQDEYILNVDDNTRFWLQFIDRTN